MAMSNRLLIDCAWTKPTPAAVKAAGYSGVIGYISHDDTGKDLTAAQANTYRRAGLQVGFVFETTATEATRGHGAGVADREFAEAQARERGYPAGCVIFFACDQDVPAAKVLPYYRGVGSVRGDYEPGVYGSRTVVEGVMRLPEITHAWQTEAWSGTRISAHADLYQRIRKTARHVAGVKASAYDEDVLLRPLPLWGATSSVSTAKPKPVPKPKQAARAAVATIAQPYAKAITALVIGAGAWCSTALADGVITTAEWGELAGIIVTAFGVYKIPNRQ